MQELAGHWNSLFLKDCTPWKVTLLEQVFENCSPWEGHTLEKLVQDCLPWRRETLRRKEQQEQILWPGIRVWLG